MVHPAAETTETAAAAVNKIHNIEEKKLKKRKIKNKDRKLPKKRMCGRAHPLFLHNSVQRGQTTLQKGQVQMKSEYTDSKEQKLGTGRIFSCLFFMPSRGIYCIINKKRKHVSGWI